MVRFQLPPIDGPDDAATATTMLLARRAEGSCRLPRHNELAGVLESYTRAVEVSAFEQRIRRATAQQIEHGLVRATKRLQPLDDLRGSLRRAAAQERFGERAQHALIVGRKASGDQDEPAFRLAVTCIKMAAADQGSAAAQRERRIQSTGKHRIG